MRDPSSETFERSLAGLPQPALAAFVADLWAARGWETRVEDGDDGTLVVCTRGGEVVTILLPAKRPLGATLGRIVRAGVRRDGAAQPTHGVDVEATATVDVVVSPAPDARVESFAASVGARVYDARSLYDLALYGLDRPEADALFRRHLGHGIAVSADPGPTLDEPVRADDDTVGSWWFWPWNDETRGLDTLLAVVVVALVGVVVAGSLGVGLGGADGGTAVEAFGNGTGTTSDSGPSGSNSGNFGDTDPFGTGPPPGDWPDGEGSSAPSLAPGLAPDGVTSPDTLARAHATRIDGQSYVWRVNYTERSADGATRASAVHRVRNARVYRVDVETTGVLATDPGQLVPRPAYADGDRRYVLSRGQILQGQLESRDHYAGHAETALFRLLRADESEVVDGWEGREAFLYRVSLSDSPDPDRQAYRATALVTPEGVVHLVEAEWVDRESNVTVSVRAAYDFVDEPNVSRPEWAWPANEVSTDNSTTRSPTPTTDE